MGDQVGHAVRQRIGLARARPGNHQQRPRQGRLADAKLRRIALRRVELGEDVVGGRGGVKGEHGRSFFSAVGGPSQAASLAKRERMFTLG